MLALAGHSGPGRPSVRSLRTAVAAPGWAVPSTQTIHADLLVLRQEGLVEWTPGEDGSLRALVGVAAVSREQLPLS